MHQTRKEFLNHSVSLDIDSLLQILARKTVINQRKDDI